MHKPFHDFSASALKELAEHAERLARLDSSLTPSARRDLNEFAGATRRLIARQQEETIAELNAMPMWILMDTETGTDAVMGGKYKTFRGEVVTLQGGTPPHKPSSTGRIQTSAGEFFPSVCGLQWVRNADNPNW